MWLADLQFLAQSLSVEISWKDSFEGTLDVPRRGVCLNCPFRRGWGYMVRDPLVTPERGHLFALGEIVEGRIGLPSLAMPSHGVLHERVSLEDWNLDDVLDVHIVVVVALLGDRGNLAAWG